LVLGHGHADGHRRQLEARRREARRKRYLCFLCFFLTHRPRTRLVPLRHFFTPTAGPPAPPPPDGPPPDRPPPPPPSDRPRVTGLHAACAAAFLMSAAPGRKSADT